MLFQNEQILNAKMDKGRVKMCEKHEEEVAA